MVARVPSRAPHSLAHHKAVVRHWHEHRTPGVSQGNGLKPSESERRDHRTDHDWSSELCVGSSHRVNETDERDSLSLPVKLSSHEISEDSAVVSMRTVGDVKSSYRSRSRLADEISNRKALQLIERRRVDPQTRHELPVPAPASAQVVVTPHPAKNSSDATSSSDSSNDVITSSGNVFQLDISQLVSSGDYRKLVLRAIRQDLSSGRNVRLHAQIHSALAVSEIKLSLQQLCSDSLLFCARDQNILPAVDVAHGLAVLELIPRSRQMATLGLD